MASILKAKGHSAERVVRSTKEECLKRRLLLGERHLRRTIAEFVAHCSSRTVRPLDKRIDSVIAMVSYAWLEKGGKAPTSLERT
jgi:hypothetical protein